MKLFTFLFVGIIFLISANKTLAYTSYNYNSGHGTSYYNNSEGTTGTTRYSGNRAYYNYSNPKYGSVSGSSYKSGNATYYYGGVNGSSLKSGNSTYYYGDVNGSSIKSGKTTYYYLNGKATTCLRSGNYSYCN